MLFFFFCFVWLNIKALTFYVIVKFRHWNQDHFQNMYHIVTLTWGCFPHTKKYIGYS